MTNDIAALGRAVLERRQELDLRQDQFSAGPSNTTVSALETGQLEAISAATLRKLDRSLGWNPGSSKAVMQGGQAVVAGSLAADATGDGRLDRLERLAEAQAAAAAELLAEVQSFRRSPTGRPTPGQRRRAELDQLGEESQDSDREERQPR